MDGPNHPSSVQPQWALAWTPHGSRSCAASSCSFSRCHCNLPPPDHQGTIVLGVRIHIFISPMPYFAPHVYLCPPASAHRFQCITRDVLTFMLGMYLYFRTLLWVASHHFRHRCRPILSPRPAPTKIRFEIIFKKNSNTTKQTNVSVEHRNFHDLLTG